MGVHCVGHGGPLPPLAADKDLGGVEVAGGAVVPATCGDTASAISCYFVTSAFLSASLVHFCKGMFDILYDVLPRLRGPNLDSVLSLLPELLLAFLDLVETNSLQNSLSAR